MDDQWPRPPRTLEGWKAAYFNLLSSYSKLKAAIDLCGPEVPRLVMGALVTLDRREGLKDGT